ncbi:MAG: trans-sulfuration enzyme family protein [Chloroflexota bacterium]
MDKELDFATLAAHVGLHQRVGDEVATVGPIVASTTFTADSVEQVHAALSPESPGYAYARNASPTVAAFERDFAPLEQAEEAVAFGSGMAAIRGALQSCHLHAGSRIVASSDLYGVTGSLLREFESYGVAVDYVDIANLDEVEAALDAPTAALLFEAISNPLLKVADVAALAGIAQKRGATSVIDNTFATPVLLRPLAHGVDIVVHSATKYIAGHGDVVAGLVAGDRSRMTAVRQGRTISGSILSPFEAWLAMRGLRTLAVRYERQAESAGIVARWLDEQPWVERVYYPGLTDHPQHNLAREQFAGRFGAMVAFDVAGGRDRAIDFMDNLLLIAPGTSLGDLASLILYPPASSHRTLDDGQLRAIGIGPGLVRLSVGIESPADLISDLAQAARSSEKGGLAAV